MNKAKYLILLVNLTVVGYLIYLVGAGNCKSILLMLCYYPLLILVNGLLGLGWRRMSPQASRCFYWAALLLIIAFLPLLLISPWLTF